MRWLLSLLLAPVLMADSSMTVKAGALSCGAVRRAADEIQTFCYSAPGHVLRHNSLDTLNTKLVVDYIWDTSGTPSHVTWQFALKGSAVDYEVTADGAPVQTGTLCAVYPDVACPAPPAAACPIPVHGVVIVDGLTVPAQVWNAGRSCVNFWRRGTVGWYPASCCD